MGWWIWPILAVAIAAAAGIIYSFRAALDWRTWILFGVVAAAILATAGIYYAGHGHNPTTFFGAVFTAWIGGLALFVITGVLVAVISLNRPENESYDARARILFRKQAGKHIDYIITKIKDRLEHYGETASIKVTIQHYHQPERKFLLVTYDSIVLKSYLDDVETNWRSELDYSEVTSAPPGLQANKLMYVRINDAAVGSSEEFTDKINRPLSTRIERDGSCKVEYLVEHWFKADEEPHEHTPIRYNRRLVLGFENLTASPLTIRLTVGDERPIDMVVGAGEQKQVLDLSDVLPDKKVYEYRILAP